MFYILDSRTNAFVLCENEQETIANINKMRRDGDSSEELTIISDVFRWGAKNFLDEYAKKRDVSNDLFETQVENKFPHAKSRFLHNEDSVFALALHKKFGYKLEAATCFKEDAVFDSIHFYCRNNDGRYLNFMGKYESKLLFFDNFDKTSNPLSWKTYPLRSAAVLVEKIISWMGKEKYLESLNTATQIIEHYQKRYS